MAALLLLGFLPVFFPVFPREEEEEATVITDWSQSLKTDRKKGSLL